MRDEFRPWLDDRRRSDELPRPRRGSRRNGTNPRAMGTNPRAMGTNPGAGSPADMRRVENAILRAMTALDRAGVRWCHACDDRSYWWGTACTCRRLTSREADRLARFVRLADPEMFSAMIAEEVSRLQQ